MDTNEKDLSKELSEITTDILERLKNSADSSSNERRKMAAQVAMRRILNLSSSAPIPPDKMSSAAMLQIIQIMTRAFPFWNLKGDKK
jgi:hypothetical protein